jgi:AbrB family looped-hinge helix DNA binding protein
MITTAKITKKGQVTIPQKIRKQLQSDVIEFAVEGEKILIRPVKSVAASLSSYAKKGVLPFAAERENAWEEVVKERYGEKHHRR